jgi:hypothetical protein
MLTASLVYLNLALSSMLWSICVHPSSLWRYTADTTRPSPRGQGSNVSEFWTLDSPDCRFILFSSHRNILWAGCQHCHL